MYMSSFTSGSASKSQLEIQGAKAIGTAQLTYNSIRTTYRLKEHELLLYRLSELLLHQL